MTDHPDTESAVDRPEGPSVRESLIGAVGALRESPDVTNAVNHGISERDREIRSRSRNSNQDHFQREAASKDHLHGSVRNALNEATLRAAHGFGNPVKGTEVSVSPGPPPTWSTKDKQHWDTLSEPAKLAILHDHAAIKPHLERYAEIDRELSPIRHLYQQHGLSDAQGMAKMVRTVGALHDPRTAVQAYHELGRELNIAPLGYQPQQPDYSPQEAQAVEQHLGHFAQSHPHYEQARAGMGLLLQARPEEYTSRDGNFDLEKVYHDVCRILGVGLSDNRARRSAAVSPRSRSPAVAPDTPMRGGSSVRNSIIAAYQQSRGG